MSTTNPTPDAPAIADAAIAPVPAPAYEIECPYVASGPTTLRCARCGRPLMTKDARHMPTGYVCPYYVKARVATFYNAKPEHYSLLGFITVLMGAVAGFLLQLAGSIGFFAIIITLFAGPAIGGLVAEAIRRIMGKTRGQYFWLVAAISFVIGAIPFTLLPVLAQLARFSPNALFALIPVVGVGLAVSTLVARMRI